MNFRRLMHEFQKITACTYVRKKYVCIYVQLRGYFANLFINYNLINSIYRPTYFTSI